MWPENNKNAGFSLLELLAVMSIMALLTTLAVTSYFSAVRGMGRRSAVNNLANTLIQARQRACMDNARVSVVMFNEVVGIETKDVKPSYVICKAIGKITYYSSPKLVDEYTALDTVFGTENLGSGYKGVMKLYNLSQGGFSYVYPWVQEYQLNCASASKSNTPYTLNTYAFEINNSVATGQGGNVWKVGDSYGVEAAPVQNLPRGFLIKNLEESHTKVEYVTFLPDGRSLSRKTITIRELRPPNKSVSMTVSTDGQISYNEKW